MNQITRETQNHLEGSKAETTTPKVYLPTLTIAGSDSSGGAGIQADIKTMSALGCYAMSVITALTAQNSCGVRSVTGVSPQMVAEQLEMVLSDIPPLAVKTGMLYSAETVNAVSQRLRPLHIPLVVDPVMVATSGDHLITDAAIDAVRQQLLPIATLITPNIKEAEVLSGMPISSDRDLRDAADRILDMGAAAVLIKGGHLQGPIATDYLYTREGVESYSAERVATRNDHGTGCTLSSAITAYLAQGQTMSRAVQYGKEYLTRALLSGSTVTIGKGHGPVDHFHQPLASIKASIIK
ncbi:MAG: bifunctional hydroxymethylpyrimidine kinase/phosphomethylpyrimidine kinase [Porphyromonas sp.]|nr:bifunctional hydroxymethylpyrimidine kinase/phosphomethylpyrimidine kinase [Porphyromonas sp.]